MANWKRKVLIPSDHGNVHATEYMSVPFHINVNIYDICIMSLLLRNF